MRGSGEDRQSHWCKPKPVNKPGSRSEARSRGDGSADPDQKIPRLLDWGRVPACAEVVTLSEELISWQSGSSCVGASGRTDRLR